MQLDRKVARNPMFQESTMAIKWLNAEFGKGFSQRNLEQMRQFYLTYSKTQTLSAEFNLSWSHYLKLMRIDNEDK